MLNRAAGRPANDGSVGAGGPGWRGAGRRAFAQIDPGEMADDHGGQRGEEAWGQRLETERVASGVKGSGGLRTAAPQAARANGRPARLAHRRIGHLPERNHVVAAGSGASVDSLALPNDYRHPSVPAWCPPGARPANTADVGAPRSPRGPWSVPLSARSPRKGRSGRGQRTRLRPECRHRTAR